MYRVLVFIVATMIFAPVSAQGGLRVYVAERESCEQSLVAIEFDMVANAGEVSTYTLTVEQAGDIIVEKSYTMPGPPQIIQGVNQTRKTVFVEAPLSEVWIVSINGDVMEWSDGVCGPVIKPLQNDVDFLSRLYDLAWRVYR